MPVNTDSVMLGAWAGNPLQDPSRILDIGTGCGILALMMAQRFPQAVIDAVDIDDQSVREATENVLQSPWADRINVSRADFRSYVSPAPYDLIVSNPPYFSRSLLSGDKRRSLARHSNKDSLSHKSLLSGASRILTPQGRFAVILPAEISHTFLMEARSLDVPLFPDRITQVFTRPEKPAARILVQIGRTETALDQQALMIYENNENRYSTEYVRLVKDFYLWA